MDLVWKIALGIVLGVTPTCCAAQNRMQSFPDHPSQGEMNAVLGTVDQGLARYQDVLDELIKNETARAGLDLKFFRNEFDLARETRKLVSLARKGPSGPRLIAVLIDLDDLSRDSAIVSANLERQACAHAANPMIATGMVARTSEISKALHDDSASLSQIALHWVEADYGLLAKIAEKLPN